MESPSGAPMRGVGGRGGRRPHLQVRGRGRGSPPGKGLSEALLLPPGRGARFVFRSPRAVLVTRGDLRVRCWPWFSSLKGSRAALSVCSTFSLCGSDYVQGRLGVRWVTCLSSRLPDCGGPSAAGCRAQF